MASTSTKHPGKTRLVNEILNDNRYSNLSVVSEAWTILSSMLHLL